MKTIRISDGIELVIVDDGGVALKDLFNGRSIAILPEELDALISALQEAKIQRVSNKFIQIAKESNVKICTCNSRQLENYGCVCGSGRKI